MRRSQGPIHVILLAVGCATLAGPALAGWSADPVTVRPTTASIPQVAACNDGSFGTFVAWQEEGVSGSGVVRVQHLLSTGDLDPAWPADGGLACDALAPRPTIGALPDHLGGVYVWWVETSGSHVLFVTRLEPTGVVAAGWPAGGMNLGALMNVSLRPSVIEDGNHGVYLAWTTGPLIKAHHLGTNGLGAGGWPNSPRVIVPADPVSTYRLWPDLALASDQGAFLSWGNWSSDTTVVESGMYLHRMTKAGLPLVGWLLDGVSLGPLRPELLQAFPYAPLLDISPDGRDGVFVHRGELRDGTGLVDSRLFRFTGDGENAPDWPADGVLTRADGSYYLNPTHAADQGLRVLPDGRDGAIVEFPNPYSDSPPIIGVSQVDASGVVTWPTSALAAGHEILVRDDGGVYVAEFKCCGPSSAWEGGAFIGVQADPPGSWPYPLEYHSEQFSHWYGDIGLAGTGDGGAVFLWSQQIDRLGLFARRFNPTGEVTGVAASRQVAMLRGLRFVSGAGVVARMGLTGTQGTLSLFDLAGRRVASRTVEGAGEVEVALPGTESLPSGMYFARLSVGATLAYGRVAITR